MNGTVKIFGQKPNRPLRYPAAVTNSLIHATKRRMTATIIRLPDPEGCRFSLMEANVIRRLEEGAQIDTIARELGLAAPMVQEYIRSVRRKVRERARISENAYSLGR